MKCQWTQTLPPYVVKVRYKSAKFRIDIFDTANRLHVVTQAPATYAPAYGVDVADSEAIQEEIARVITALGGKAAA